MNLRHVIVVGSSLGASLGTGIAHGAQLLGTSSVFVVSSVTEEVPAGMVFWLIDTALLENWYPYGGPVTPHPVVPHGSALVASSPGWSFEYSRNSLPSDGTGPGIAGASSTDNAWLWDNLVDKLTNGIPDNLNLGIGSSLDLDGNTIVGGSGQGLSETMLTGGATLDFAGNSIESIRLTLLSYSAEYDSYGQGRWYQTGELQFEVFGVPTPSASSLAIVCVAARAARRRRRC